MATQEKRAAAAAELDRDIQRFLSRGGVIARHEIRITAPPAGALANSFQIGRDRLNAKRKKERAAKESLVASQRASAPVILEMHAQGWGLRNIQAGTRMTAPFIRRTLVQADRDPDINKRNQVVSAEQIAALTETAKSGGTAAEAALWAGCSTEVAVSAGAVYGIKYRRCQEGEA